MSPRLGLAGHVLEGREHLGRVVDADNDEVARVGPSHDIADRLQLVQNDVDLPAADALLHRFLDPFADQLGRLARTAPTQSRVLTDDQHVEVLRRDGTQLAQVRVAPVTGGTDRADARNPTEVGATGASGGIPVDEVTQRPHPSSVVAVVDEDLDVVDLDEVEASGGEVVVAGERPKALPDVVQRRARRERRTGRREGVGDVEAGGAAEGRRQQVGPGELHSAPPVLDGDHVAAIGRVEIEGPTPAPTVGVDELADVRAGGGQREPDDLAGALAAHRPHVGVVGVEDGEAVLGDCLDDDSLDGGQLGESVDPAQTQVVGGHVGDDGDVVAVVPQTLTEYAAARHLHDGEVDAGVHEHHPGRLRAGCVRLDDQPLVDDDAVGGGHADLATQALEDVGDHPRGGRLAVGASDGDDRHAGGGSRREEQVDDRLGDELRHADRRVRVHPEAGRGVDLDDGPAGLADRSRDVRADEVDAGNVEANHSGSLFGDLDVVRVGVEGAVNRDATGGHVAGEGEFDHDTGIRDVGEEVALAFEDLDGGGVHLDPGEDLLVADTTARVGVGDVDEFLDGVLAVADHVGGDALSDGLHPAADDEAAIVATGDERLDDEDAAAGLLLGNVVGLVDLVEGLQVQTDAAAVVAVQRLDHDGEADLTGGVKDAAPRAHGLLLGSRQTGGRQQLAGEVFVAGDVHGQRAGARGHRRADALRVHPLTKLDERRRVEAQPRNVAADGLLDDRGGRRAEGDPVGPTQERVQLLGEVEAVRGLHEVVDQPHRQLTRGDADRLVDVAEDDVVDPRPALDHPRLATTQVVAGGGLQFQGDVLGDVAEPGPVLEPLNEAARMTHRAGMPLQSRQQGHERVGEPVDRVARIALEDTEIDDEMNGWRIGPDIGTPIDARLEDAQIRRDRAGRGGVVLRHASSLPRSGEDHTLVVSVVVAQQRARAPWASGPSRRQLRPRCRGVARRSEPVPPTPDRRWRRPAGCERRPPTPVGERHVGPQGRR